MDQAAIQLGVLLKSTPTKDKKTTLKKFIDITHMIQAFVDYSEMSEDDRVNVNIFQYFFGSSIIDHNKPISCTLHSFHNKYDGFQPACHDLGLSYTIDSPTPHDYPPAPEVMTKSIVFLHKVHDLIPESSRRLLVNPFLTHAATEVGFCVFTEHPVSNTIRICGKNILTTGKLDYIICSPPDGLSEEQKKKMLAKGLIKPGKASRVVVEVKKKSQLARAFGHALMCILVTRGDDIVTPMTAILTDGEDWNFLTLVGSHVQAVLGVDSVDEVFSRVCTALRGNQIETNTILKYNNKKRLAKKKNLQSSSAEDIKRLSNQIQYHQEALETSKNDLFKITDKPVQSDGYLASLFNPHNSKKIRLIPESVSPLSPPQFEDPISLVVPKKGRRLRKKKTL